MQGKRYIKSAKPSAKEATCAVKACAGAANSFDAWLAKYTPVEQAIMAAREKRLNNAARRREERAYHFGGLCEATGGLAAYWRRKETPIEEQISWADGDAFTLMQLVRYHRLASGQALERLRHRLRRPLYYKEENARRRALAASRRKIFRRTTENPCPTREAILDAWLARRNSPADAIRFGSLIEDLECYLDNSLVRNESGGIVGRRGGIKRWLQTEIPALYLCYTTVMRYKAAARRLRQITGISDPTPAARIVEEKTTLINTSLPVDNAAQRSAGDDVQRSDDAVQRSADDDVQCSAGDAVQRSDDDVQRPSATRKLRHPGQWPRPQNMSSLALVRARAIWREVIAPIRPNPTALMARLEFLLGAECTDKINLRNQIV